MKQFFVDGAKMTDRVSAHDHLIAALSLPDYYGRNLDALFDCLTELSACTIFLQNTAQLCNSGTYGQAILDTFRDAAAETPGLTLIESV